MKRMLLFLGVVALIMVLAGSAIAADVSKIMPMPPKAKLMNGNEPIGDVPYYPSSPGTICSPGDTMGFTQYDYQSNGSSGRRIVVDSQGGIHMDWMCGDPYPLHRNVKFNCLTNSGSPWPGVGQTSSRHDGAGYCQIAITTDDRAALAYHFAPTNNESTFVAIDAFSCLGAFDYYKPLLRSGASHMIWPYISIDRSNRIHIVATTVTATAGDPEPLGYTRSNNGGTTWVATAVIDTVVTISCNVVSSPVSDKVAIVYSHPTDLTSQWLNDIYYVQSTNGTSWDFRNGKINVTHYGLGGDSLYAYTDLTALYDYNDNLHIIWNAQYISPSSGGVYYAAKLLHYDIASGTISQIAQFDSTWPSAGCEFGVWNFSFAKMSMATDLGNNLYCAYTSWDTSDCSQGGFANGDIYLQYSTDHGTSWASKINLTNSHSPQCFPGDCESDHWSSLAEKADTSIHLFYVNDRDAGGIPQTEGTATDNPMLYLSYSDGLPLTSVNEDINKPRAFTLAQNYPNPFNARTNISFELAKPGFVDLTVYDISGAKVATLVSENMAAGTHQVNWDASSVASGVYYYSLKANGSEVTKKMTLLK
jgi:hypothetical protein